MSSSLVKKLVTTLAVTLSVLVAAPAAFGDRPLYIKASAQGVITLGGFHPLRQPTLGAATRALGEPTGTAGGGVDCTVRWSSIGLVICFANFGGYDACTQSGGFAGSAIVKGRAARRWRTDRGLRVGASLATLRKLYPAAAYHSGGYYPKSWWLVVGTNPYGQGCPCPQPILRAKLNRGHVSSFRLWIGSAGD